MKKVLSLIIVVMLLVTVFTGCGKDDEKGTVKLGYVNWAEGVAMTHLAQVILEDKMGYEVDLTMADAAPIFTSVASGNYDAFLDAWLPVTHEDYMEDYGDDIVDLGYNYEGARIGVVVPEYVDINTIEEMNDAKDQFEEEIVGIDAGAGIMKATNTAIDEYDLEFELLTSSGPMMAAALEKAIENGDWIAVTGWKPHWKFARWELKFLEDSKGVYGAIENIHTIARKDIEEDMPEVADFLKNFKLDDQQLGDLMGRISDGETGQEEDLAREWMEDNEDLVDSWLD
ncbi:MAG: glycine betaine ABC transporter substrate-binding protein [Eubacteriales bacterium]